MARIVIPIFFDYASTLCYVAWRIVDQLQRELDFAPLWKGVPIALRDRRAKSGRSLGPIEIQKVTTVAAETGIAVEPPATWTDSEKALRGAELAREAEVFEAYHEAVFRALFERRLDVGKIEVLAELAEASGMEPNRFRADLEGGRMVEVLDEHKREADRFSALGYPTFILGDFPLIGIQPIETMRLLIGRFIEHRRSEPQA